MGESKNNEKAIAKKNGEIEPKAKGEKSPITYESLVIMTELANIGLMSVKNVLIPKYEKENDSQNLEYAKFLASVGGETIEHYDDICKYLFEVAGNSSTGESKK